MIRILLLFFVLLSTADAQALNVPLESYFTLEEIKAAQTAADHPKMKDTEKQMVTVLNLVRLYPKKFAREYLPAVVKKAEYIEVSAAYEELVKELLNGEPLEPLSPDDFLSKHAQIHAKDMGRSGQAGHNSSGGKTFNMRMAPMQKRYSGVAENCQYGFKDAAEIVVDLLIDDGIPERGHRRNILDPAFNLIGVSVEPHKKFDVNCVQIFGVL